MNTTTMNNCNTCKHQDVQLDEWPCQPCCEDNSLPYYPHWEPIELKKEEKITDIAKATYIGLIGKDNDKQKINDNEHPLAEAFMMVIEQVSKGKGMERHGGEGVEFYEQPWKRLADTHGIGFLTGQAAKKLEEAQRMEGSAWSKEMLGAMAYMGMAILYKDCI